MRLRGECARVCGGGADDAVRGCSADDAEVVRRCAGAVRTKRRSCGCSADDAEVAEVATGFTPGRIAAKGIIAG